MTSIEQLLDLDHLPGCHIAIRGYCTCGWKEAKIVVKAEIDRWKERAESLWKDGRCAACDSLFADSGTNGCADCNPYRVKLR